MRSLWFFLFNNKKLLRQHISLFKVDIYEVHPALQVLKLQFDPGRSLRKHDRTLLKLLAERSITATEIMDGLSERILNAALSPAGLGNNSPMDLTHAGSSSSMPMTTSVSSTSKFIPVLSGFRVPGHTSKISAIKYHISNITYQISDSHLHFMIR